MTIKPTKCPICGTINDRKLFYEENFGVAEDHYFCTNCTYFSSMCYSPYIEGIIENFPKEYADIVDQKRLKIYSKYDAEKLL